MNELVCLLLVLRRLGMHDETTSYKDRIFYVRKHRRNVADPNKEHRIKLRSFMYTLILLGLEEDDDWIQDIHMNVCGNYYNRVYKLQQKL